MWVNIKSHIKNLKTLLTASGEKNSNVYMEFIKYVELNVVAPRAGGGNRNHAVVKFFCCLLSRKILIQGRL